MTMTEERLGLVPRPITPGSEMEALRRFFPDVTWTGSIRAGGMAPGTPEMTARGRGTHHLIQQGRWIVGDYEQEQYLDDGTFVLRWQLHLVVGWAPETSGYVATMTDNYGHADVYAGRIDGDRLIFESSEGRSVRLRFTWDVADPDDVLWRNEMAVGTAPWFLIEEYHMEPASLSRCGAERGETP
jgi:hypothetical protein